MWCYNLAQKFQKIVAENPESSALIFDNQRVSYSQLEESSHRALNLLESHSISKGDVICISSDKRLEAFSLVVACWKLGVTYSFIDRLSPPQRLEKIIRTCEPKAIFGESDLNALLTTHTKTIFHNFNEVQSYDPKPPLEIDSITGNCISYIMFTSGSTGDPNGVAISHQNLLNFAQWANVDIGITSEEIVTGANSHFFDNSVFDIYGTLLNGGTLVPLSRDDVKDPNTLSDALQKTKATIWFSVPSLLNYHLRLKTFLNKEYSLKKIIFGGEGFPKGQLQELFEIFDSHNTELINVYGPTECTCICSSYKITKNDFTEGNMSLLAPLGSLTRNFSYLIVDEFLKPVPQGEIGELLLGGPHVGMGYFNNPEKTSQKYIQNPTHQKFHDPHYLTGDLVKFSLDDKKLYFCGRKDSQIKFMGYRIELGEIESCLSSHPSIRESAVLFGKISGMDMICSFISGDIDKSEVKKFLQDSLPSYMIPRKIKIFKELPKNSNGKVDKKQLFREFYD